MIAISTILVIALIFALRVNLRVPYHIPLPVSRRSYHHSLPHRHTYMWLVYISRHDNDTDPRDRLTGRSTSMHYSDVKIDAMASQITRLTIVCSAVYSGEDQRKYQSYASLAFVRGIHRWPVNSPHEWPVTRKMFPFDDVIMGLMQRLVSPVLMSSSKPSIYGLI